MRFMILTTGRTLTMKIDYQHFNAQQINLSWTSKTKCILDHVFLLPPWY